MDRLAGRSLGRAEARPYIRIARLDYFRLVLGAAGYRGDQEDAVAFF
jgi:hypothetical protein